MNIKTGLKGALLLCIFSINSFSQTTATKASQPTAGGDANQLFLFAEKMPMFPGGEGKLREFLIKNFRYPDYEREHGITGTTNVSFVVEKDGRLTDIKVVKGVPKGSGCDDEGIRLVKMMPKWKPGIEGGKIVRVQMSLPIIFSIQKQPAKAAAKQPAKPTGTNNQNVKQGVKK